MSTTTSANSQNLNPMAIKQEAIHQPDVSLPETTTTTTLTDTNTNTTDRNQNGQNINHNHNRSRMIMDDDSTEDERDTNFKLDPTGMRIPKKNVTKYHHLY